MAQTAWRRWQDWAAVAVGVLTALAPIVVATDAVAMTTMIVLGVLVVAAGLWSLAVPGMVASEYVHIVLGALLFLAPWVMTYTAFTAAAWTSWVAGVLVAASGAAALPAATAAHRGLAGQH